MELKEVLMLIGTIVSVGGGLVGVTLKIIGVINTKTDTIRIESKEDHKAIDANMAKMYDRINETHGMAIENKTDIKRLDIGFTALEQARSRDAAHLEAVVINWNKDIAALKSPG